MSPSALEHRVPLFAANLAMVCVRETLGAPGQNGINIVCPHCSSERFSYFLLSCSLFSKREDCSFYCKLMSLPGVDFFVSVLFAL